MRTVKYISQQISEISKSSKRKDILFFLLLFILIFSLLRYGYGSVKAFIGPKRSIDFAVYYTAASMIREGDYEFYEREKFQKKAEELHAAILQGSSYFTSDYVYLPYNYPPLFAIFLIPFTWIGYSAARIMWFFLNQVFLFTGIYFLTKSFTKKVPFLESFLLVCMALNFFPVIYSLYMGQINLLLFLLLSIAFYSAKLNRDLIAGLCLATASMFKVNPVLLVLYFLWKKRYRLFLSTMLGILIFVLFSTTIVGIKPQIYYLTSVIWRVGGGVFYKAFYRNQSLTGFYTRLFSDNPYTTAIYHSETLTKVIIFLSSLVLLALTLYFSREKSIKPEKLDLEFSLFTVLILLVSPISWEHHFVLLILPFSVLVNRYLQSPLFRGRQLILTGLGMFSYIIISFFFEYGFEYEGINTGVISLIVSAKFYALFLMWVIFAFLNRDSNRLD